jgi:predicted TIM-barrel fold metal-dependent hydrolase
MPWFDEYQAIGGVLAADITEEDKRNIFYRNVERIFGKDW